MKRRDFLGSTPCAALGSMGVTNTLLNLRMLNNAVAATADPDDYKALVCVFLVGGNDSYNMLVPTASSEHTNYSLIRSNLALAAPDPNNANSLLPLAPTNTGGRPFGLHPQMPNLYNRFNEGNAAFLANVGTLVAPTTIAQYQNGSVDLPRGLFGHNTQQRVWQTAVANNLSGLTGWAGRLADKVLTCNTSNQVSMNISLDGNQIWLVGDESFSYSISRNGADVLDGLGSSNDLNQVRVQAAQSLVEQEQRNIFMRAFGEQKKTSYESSEFFSNGFDSVNLGTNFGSSGLSGDFEGVAKSIAARNVFGHKRQVFYVRLTGFDNHDELLNNQSSLLGRLDESLNEFWESMVDMGLEDKVTVFSASDFGRTIRSNGLGTDHAWGGNSFMIGGAVDGNKIYGDYPDASALTIGGGLDVGTNGRYLPTTSVDSYFAELALWFGLPPGELDQVIPNIGEFYSYSPTTAPIGFLL